MVKYGEGLTPSEARKRKYPQVGLVDTPNDYRELVHAIENNPKLSEKRKLKELRYARTLTYSPSMKKSFKKKGSSIIEARKIAEGAINSRLETCPHCGYTKVSRGGNFCPRCKKRMKLC